MSYDNVNEVVHKLFESLLSVYQIGLETSMRRSDFIFDSVQLLYYKCHKINFKRGGSYIDSTDWIKKKNNNNNIRKVQTINVLINCCIMEKLSGI